MAELGYPGFEATLWLGAFAPAGTPQAAVNRISADIGTVLKNPEVRARLEGLGGEVVGMPQEVFAKLYARDLERWGKSIRDLNIRID
jgi:tripartite-type tricarboxylate transporter receptor subunit TctC